MYSKISVCEYFDVTRSHQCRKSFMRIKKAFRLAELKKNSKAEF